LPDLDDALAFLGAEGAGATFRGMRQLFQTVPGRGDGLQWAILPMATSGLPPRAPAVLTAISGALVP
jgi:hypothetical protein